MSRAGRRRSGLYHEGDLCWQVNRERVLLLAGPRALLMQLAHPLVAQGVADHSEFQRHPLRRLRRTLAAMLGILFGSTRRAHACAERVNRVHAGVHGTLRDGTRVFPAGTRYCARDPALLFWVFASLIDSSVTAYQSFVRPLSADERQRFYREVRRMAPLLGIPDPALPQDWCAFEREIERLLAGPILEITPTARALADVVIHPPIPGLPRAVGDLGSIVTFGLLPDILRARYGFAWTPARQRAWRILRSGIRHTRPLLPPRIRHLPQAPGGIAARPAQLAAPAGTGARGNIGADEERNRRG